MKKKSTQLSLKLIITLLLITPLVLFAGEITVNNGKTQIVYGKANYQDLSLTATISNIQFRDIQTRNGSFTEFFVSGFGYSNVPGDPKLPVYKKLIEVPAGASYSISVTGQSFKEYDLADFGIMNKLIPAQPPVSKSSNPDDLPFIYNSASYLQNKWLGEPLVTVTNVGMHRMVNLARVEVSPVQYNPVTNRIRVYDNLEIKVIFAGADVSATIQHKKEFFSPYFNNLYHFLPNYQEVPDALITAGPVTYVVVAPRMFEDALQPLINWKKKKGFQVIEGYTDEPAVGNTTTSIQNWLEGLYNTPPAGFEPPSFVLFVGDVAQVPTFSTGGHPSDLYYCDYTNDEIPEVFYGRFSASSLTQLQPYIDKTLEYEKYLMPSDAFLGEVTMVAGADASHQLTWGNGQINYGTTYYFNSAHGLLSHTYLQPEPSGGNYSALIRGDVSNGVAYSNYTAHGSESGWADPSFLINHIPALQNDHKYGLMVGNCCLTAKYNVNCFAEEITRAAGKGVLGYIGCSDYSYWDEDYFWGVGFKSVVTNPVYNAQHLGSYDVTFHDQGETIDQWFVTQGQMVQGGNFAVEESNSGMKLYYWQAYNLMGDPSLSIYFSVPPAITATYPATLLVGTTGFQVVTEPYAYVGLTINETTLIDAKCADATGIIDFTFPALNTPDTLSVVITKQNRKPHFGSINVIPATGPYVVMNTFSVNDSVYGNHDHIADYAERTALDVTVKNIGVIGSGDIVGTLSTADTNVTILNNSYTFGSVAPGATVTGCNIFDIQIRNNVADQYKVTFNLELTDGTNTWNSEIKMNVNSPVITIGDMTVLDPAPGGNGNGILDPGETAKLRIRLANSGHAYSGNTISHLNVLPVSAPFIMVSNPVSYVGPFTPGSFYDIEFNVVINGITPVGTMSNLSNIVTTGSQSQFAGTKSFAPEIGQLPQYNMTTTTITTCAGKFFDTGGPTVNYSDNEDVTMTFNTSTPGASLTANFVQFDVEPQTTCNYDWLKAFNGTGTSAPLIGTWCGNSIPADLTASSGSLTFQFHSDYSDNFGGWEINLSCSGGVLGLNANAFPSSVCEGGSSQLVAIPAGGSGNYTYLWNPSTYLDDPTSKTPVCTPGANITYTVTVNDGVNSVTSSPIAIAILPLPATPAVTFDGITLQSSSATGNQWFLNGAMIPGANEQTLVPSAPGEYYVAIRSEDTGCQSEPSNIIPYLITGVKNVNKGNVTIYPNPSQGDFTVSFDLPLSGKYNISVIDGTGRIVKNLSSLVGSTGKNKITLSASDLPAGIYYLELTTGSFRTVNKLILSK